MSFTGIDFAEHARQASVDLYFVAEGDRAGNIERHVIRPANPCCNCYSIAKAFTVLAVGQLYDRGLLRPEDVAVEFIPDLCPEGMDERWHRVTLEHLMLHYVGFGSEQSGLIDIDSYDASAFPSHDYLSLILGSPLPHEPGTHHQYTDAAYYLLSRVIARVAGMDLADFLRPTLMDVMSFKELAWSTCPLGYSMGATGLYLRTEDVVKLGILYLRGGDWMGQRVVSEEWTRLVLERGYEFKDKGNGWYGKGGMRGQTLTFNPERGLAVAWHAYDRRKTGVVYDLLMHGTEK